MAPLTPGVWHKKVAKNVGSPNVRVSIVRTHERRATVSKGKQALLPNGRLTRDGFANMTPAERDRWLKGVLQRAGEVRKHYEEDGLLCPRRLRALVKVQAPMLHLCRTSARLASTRSSRASRLTGTFSLWLQFAGG